MTTGIDRNRLAAFGIGLAVILFLAANLFVQNTTREARLDLTQGQLFTLSDGTKRTLAELDEPIRVRLYLSRGLIERAPQLATYAERVRELLETYATLSGGRLTLEVVDPQPFSPEEDRAVGFGLQGVPLGQGAGQGFFGLAASNSTDDREVIPFLSPDRETFLEYDLTKLVHALANPGKPKVAVIDGLGLRGSPGSEWQPLQVFDQLAPFVDMTFLGGDVDAIADGTAVLLLVHPQNLPEKTLYAIDQFVLGGGRAMVFVDPLAETQGPSQPGVPPLDTASDLPTLFAAWGVRFTADAVVLDRLNAVEVQASSQGRPVVTRYLPWLSIRADGLSRDDAVTGELTNLTFTSAGAFSLAEGAAVTLTPLASSSVDSGTMPATDVKNSTDPLALARGYAPADQVHVLAARLTGDLKTAFPDGPPVEPAAPDAPKPPVPESHRAASVQPVNIILVGDVDVLADRNWLRLQNVFGQRVGVPFADNADFTVNALENLAGGGALIGLRSRGTASRPFDRVAELQVAADTEYRATEQALLQKLEATEARLTELGGAAEGNAILTPEQTEEIERFRTEALRVRSELREVQRALRADIEALETRLAIVNIAVVPVLIVLAGVGAALLRGRRRPPVRTQAA